MLHLPTVDPVGIPDPTTVTTWPQAVVFIALILAVLVVPGVLGYLANKNAKNVKDTLTQKNGGSTVRDQLDRLEKGVAGLYDRVAAVEKATAVTDVTGKHEADPS